MIGRILRHSTCAQNRHTVRSRPAGPAAENPAALSFGSTSVAGNNYTSLVLALKKGGVGGEASEDVSFAGGGQSVMMRCSGGQRRCDQQPA